MLGDALFFPKARDGWLKTVVIGGVLLVTSFLFVPYFVLNGYLIRVARSGSMGRSQPPEFEEWPDLFIDGLLLFAMQIIYGIVGVGIPVVIAVMTISRSLRPSQTPDPTPMLSTGEMVLLVFAYLFALFVSYVSLAALARFAHEDRFEAAFEMRAVFRTAFTSDFFIAWVLSLSLSLILGAISALLSLIVVGLLGLFYTSVAVYYLIGRGYRKANDRRTYRTSPD
jgi:hypothetical protein